MSIAASHFPGDMPISMRATLRRTRWFAALPIAAIAASWAFDRFVGPPVPEPAGLDRMDPIVAEAVREALDSARRQRGDESRRMTLGMVYEANGMLGLAMACYGEVAEARPRDARVRYRIAQVEERSGDLRAAIESARRVVELDPSYRPARAQLGLWLLDDGRMDEAAAHFREVVEGEPGNEAALFGMVLHAMRAREPERASKLLVEHDLLNGSNPGYARHLDLNIRRQLGERVSVPEAGPAREVRPQWRDPWNDAVRAHQTGVRLLRKAARRHLDRGEYAQAATLLERARRAEPGNTRILIALATCYRNQGRTREAAAALDEAFRLAPDDYWTNLNRADMLLAERRADPEALRAAYGHALAATRTRPESGDAWALVGRACQAMRRLDEAIDAFLHAYEVDSRDSSVLTQAGFLLYQQERTDEAEELFRRVCRLDRQAGSPRIGLAMIAMDRKGVKEAAALLEEARHLRHDHARLWEHAAERLQGLRVEMGDRND